MVARPARRMLLVRTDSRLCAFPVESVAEIMRPLPVDPVLGMPPFVQGLAIIRGEPVPVVDLGALLERSVPAPAGRFVLLRLGERRVAVASVLGLSELDATFLQPAAGPKGGAHEPAGADRR